MVQSLYITDKSLMEWQGASAWRYETGSGQVTQASPALTDAPFLWFAVSSLTAGIWWLPTTSQTPPTSWQELGGITHLEAGGPGMWTSVNSKPVVRPTSLLWWVPRKTLEASSLSTVPARQDGHIIGEFPQQPPPGDPAQQITVERIPNGVIITVSGGPLTIDIQGGSHE